MDPDKEHKRYYHDKMSPETKEAFTSVNRELTQLKNDFKEMKDNHLAHIRDDISAIKLQIQEYSTNQKWVMRIGTFVIVQGLAVLFAIFIK